MDVLALVFFVLYFIHECRSSNPCKNDYRAIYGHTACLHDDGRVKKSGVTTKQRKLIVRLHNKLRGKVKVRPGRKMPTDLVEMVWDDEIALIAQKWASQCSNDHDSFRHRYIPAYGVTIGQNLAYGYKSWKSVIRGGWYKEIKTFYYGHKRGVVGHFTQMVSNRAVQIGCGFAFCENTHYKRYYVCNYGSGSHIVLNKSRRRLCSPVWKRQTTFTHPFTPGKRCSACPGNCVKGLCSKDCAGKLCKNGGKLELFTCSCHCSWGYTGLNCEHKKEDDTNFDRRVVSFNRRVIKPSQGKVIHIQPQIQSSNNNWRLANCFGKVCRNGGTLESPRCTCKCPVDYTGTRCERRKEDKTVFDRRLVSHQRRVLNPNRGNILNVRPNVQSSRNADTATADCFGKVCRNGGTMESPRCTCKCPVDYTGTRCERRKEVKTVFDRRLVSHQRRVLNPNRGNILNVRPNVQSSRNADTATAAHCPVPMDNPEGCGTVFRPETCAKYYNIKDKCPYMCGVCRGRVQKYRSRQGCIFHGVRPSPAQCRTFGDGTGKDKWFCAAVGGDWGCNYCTKYTNVGKDCSVTCGLCD